MSQGAAVSLLVKPVGPAGAVLEEGLRAAGLRVVSVPTVYDAVAEAQRAGPGMGRLVVGIDGFGPNEFRVFPLMRREWPQATLVACHSPGFEYKGRIAELVGADVVLCGIDDVVQFIESLAPQENAVGAGPSPDAVGTPSEPFAGQATREEPVPADSVSPSQVSGVGMPPSAQAPMTEIAPASPRAYSPRTRDERAAPPPPAEKSGAVQSKSPPPPPSPPPAVPPEVAAGQDLEGEIIGTIELTEEELRLLLGEDEEA